MKMIASFLALTVLLTACTSMKPPAHSSNASLSAATFDWKINRAGELKYLLYLPPGYDETRDKRWSLMLFLHGAGERGDDVQRVAVHGPLSLVNQGTNFPLIIVAPLCPADESWDNQPLLKFLDHVTEKYAVDTNRVYLTGLSLGGYGAWKLGLTHPERFAALAPICGGVSLIDLYLVKTDRGEAVKRLPIWAFHGAKDDLFSPDESARAINALRQHGGRELKLTIYPEANHNSWTETYKNPELYEWLLKQSR
jgi:predicted peptidase